MNKLLLHICCGPCALMPLKALREEGFEVTGFFMNPNIHPLSEYLKRREALVTCAAKLELPIIFADKTWDIKAWLAARAGKCDSGEARCASCYAERLRATHDAAVEGGFKAFSTTLLYSRRQRHELIAAIGLQEAQNAAAKPGDKGIAFLYRDFRPMWQQGIDESKSLEIYRQNYCGCIYSEAERHEKKLHGFLR